MEATLELQQLTKIIGRRTIVNNIDLKIYPGEVFGLLGPNGAGKTTTIRLLLGLIKPTSGVVLVNGKDLHGNFEESISEIGAIVESPEFYKRLTGYQNLEQSARLYGSIPKSKIDEIVRFVNLEQAINQRVSVYSLGMKQRLGLALALLNDPTLILLDEPMNGLDPQGIHELRAFLRKIAVEKNVTVVVSSHILSEMELLCDRVGIINKGKLIAVKKMSELTVTDASAPVTFSLRPGLDALLVRKAIDEITAATGSSVTVQPNTELFVSCAKEQIPEVNKILVQNDLPVYAIESRSQSLESQYLEIVEGLK